MITGDVIMEKNATEKLPKNVMRIMSGMVKYIEAVDEKEGKKGAPKNAKQTRRI